MTERPILFSAPMVRALLAGAKTQTRRIVKPQPPPDKQRAAWYEPGVMGWAPPEVPSQDWHRVRCPYGQAGDRLWVRETFMHEPADYCWEASVSIPCRPAVTVYRADHDARESAGAGWKPSIHMPRALSRITLEVTGVRVERLQDISEADAIAEGIERTVIGDDWRRYVDRESELAGVHPCMTPRASYQSLWESINGPGSWDANPWVWVVEFKRCG